MSLLDNPNVSASQLSTAEILYQKRKELEERRRRFRQEIDAIYDSIPYDDRTKIYNHLASKLGGQTLSSPHYDDFIALAELIN